MLTALRKISDDFFQIRLKKSWMGHRCASVSHRDVAHVCDGGMHDRNTTVRQTGSVATRLSTRSINAIAEITSKTYADIIIARKELNKQKQKSTSTVMCSYDCNLFKRFFVQGSCEGRETLLTASRMVMRMHKLMHLIALVIVASVTTTNVFNRKFLMNSFNSRSFRFLKKISS